MLVAVVAAFLSVDCRKGEEGDSLSGAVIGGGSSTVYPMGEVVAEEIREEYGRVDMLVELSGTGGDLKKSRGGETEFSHASRPVK